VFVYGPGGNGKSVFLNTVTSILKDYAVTSAMETFTVSNGDKHPTDLAMLCGARLVTASETEEGRAWAESRIKQMTGGDPITARFMRRDFFTYTPQFKLIVIGNHSRSCTMSMKLRGGGSTSCLSSSSPPRRIASLSRS
jgi:putative DNA primase/helicase